VFNQLEHGAVYRNCDDDSVGQCDNDRAVISGPGLTDRRPRQFRPFTPAVSVGFSITSHRATALVGVLADFSV